MEGDNNTGSTIWYNFVRILEKDCCLAGHTIFQVSHAVKNTSVIGSNIFVIFCKLDGHYCIDLHESSRAEKCNSWTWQCYTLLHSTAVEAPTRISRVLSCTMIVKKFSQQYCELFKTAAYSDRQSSAASFLALLYIGIRRRIELRKVLYKYLVQ